MENANEFECENCGTCARCEYEQRHAEKIERVSTSLWRTFENELKNNGVIVPMNNVRPVVRAMLSAVAIEMVNNGMVEK